MFSLVGRLPSASARWSRNLSAVMSEVGLAICIPWPRDALARAPMCALVDENTALAKPCVSHNAAIPCHS
jgi:hypothetical protein